jgi:signal transduction histidine kinase
VISGGASSWSDHYRFQRGDGAYADFVDRGFIVRDDAGQPIRMIGSMTDVTAINRMQAQLLHSDRLAALGTLAAGVGHEINNPLSYVVSNLETLLEELPDGVDRQLLADALEGASRIAEIVRSLRTFTRPDTGEARATDVQPSIEAALRMAENAIRFRAKLTRVLSPVPQIRANAGELAQVCLNLLINAAQAIDEGDPDNNEITVATFTAADGAVTIAITDTGSGIPADNLRRIFDPFFTTKAVGTGSGLGLSICHGIVRKLGGEILVESVEGVGSTFACGSHR